MVLPQHSSHRWDSPGPVTRLGFPSVRRPVGRLRGISLALSARARSPESLGPGPRESGAMARENGDAGRGETWKKQVDDIKKIFDFKEVLGT